MEISEKNSFCILVNNRRATPLTPVIKRVLYFRSRRALSNWAKVHESGAPWPGRWMTADACGIILTNRTSFREIALTLHLLMHRSKTLNDRRSCKLYV